jgi:hypothetical protein
MRDCFKRLWGYRTFKFGTVDSQLDNFVQQAKQLVAGVAKPFTDEQMNANARGYHWFSIFGYDRNNKKVKSSCILHWSSMLKHTLIGPLPLILAQNELCCSHQVF